MAQPVDAAMFLRQLREENGKQVQNFKALSRYLAFKARERGIPVAGQFELTPLCNFDCRMCYVHLSAEQMKGRCALPVQTWKDLIRQAWEAGMIEATLTGGECLAWPGFEEIFLYLHSLGCEVRVLTNGYFLDSEKIRFFRDHKPAQIQVTLYGWNDDVYERVTGHRSFGVVTENIRRATEAGLAVSVNVTPSVFLGQDVLETIRVGKSLSPSFTVNSSLFSPREETGRSLMQNESETELYLRIYKLIRELDGIEITPVDEGSLPPIGGPCHESRGSGLRCGGGRSSFVIDWKGTLMPCNRLDMIRADALAEGFKEAWTKINREAESWPRVPECEGCAYADACTSCAANQMRFAKPGQRPEKLCEQTKTFVMHGVRSVPVCE